jgi:hypothetical protein
LGEEVRINEDHLQRFSTLASLGDASERIAELFEISKLRVDLVCIWLDVFIVVDDFFLDLFTGDSLKEIDSGLSS